MFGNSNKNSSIINSVISGFNVISSIIIGSTIIIIVTQLKTYNIK